MIVSPPAVDAGRVLRVAFNATPLVAPQLRGWTRYAVNLLAALPRHGVRPILLARGSLNLAHLARLPVGFFDLRTAPPMSYLRWEQVWVPRACNDAAVDVYHCPLNFGIPLISPVPRVLTLHDAIGLTDSNRPVPWRERWSRSHLSDRFYHLMARTMAERIIAVSEHARGDLIDRLRLDPGRVTVVPEAADPIFLAAEDETDRAATRAALGLIRPYFFYVGGWEERKNIPFLLRGFAAANLSGIELVLAGGRPEQWPELIRLADELGIGDRLRLLGFIPDPYLPALYGGALGFVYPSCYEGFGLQLVEAMAVGCPVLAAKATSLPEVLGTGGTTFGLDDHNDLAAQIRRLATEPHYRASMVVKARLRAADFSWDRTAAATAQIYLAMAGA